MGLQVFIALAHNPLEYAVIKGSIKAASVSPSLPVLIIHIHEALYFDVEAFIVDKLIHEHRQRE